MKKLINTEAYILGLELTVKTLSGRIKSLEEVLNKERVQNEKCVCEMKGRIASLEADIKRSAIENNTENIL